MILLSPVSTVRVITIVIFGKIHFMLGLDEPWILLRLSFSDFSFMISM